MHQREPSHHKYVQQLSDQRIVNIGQALNMYTGFENDYLVDRDIKAHSSLVHRGSDLSLFLAGSMALDIASKCKLSIDERSNWIDEARHSWQEVLDNGERLGRLSNSTIESSIALSSLSSYASILLNNQLPNQKLRDKYFGRLCETGRISYEKWEQIKSVNPNYDTKELRDRRIRLSGIIGELSILMLLNRFIKYELDDQEQIALPSRLTEDRGINRRKGSSLVNAWDVSLFQQFEGYDIEMPNKIQVKTTSKNSNSNHFAYQSDIANVYIKEDLAITAKEQQYGFSPSIIISDILAEQEGSHTTQITNRLDNRTEKLLDVIND